MLHFPPIGTFAAGYNAPSGPAFNGGNIAYGSLYEAAQAMASYSASSAPTAGGTLTINGVSLGSYDFCVKQGAQTISAFTATDWFTGTQDTRSAFVVVNGALTINTGITVIPTVRKLFVVVYCTGNLTVNGTLSMSLRGANHSGTGNSGGATTAGAIRIATGTYSGISNPTILAAGASGGAATPTNFAGNPGQSAGASIRTGGGGGGALKDSNSANPTWGPGAGAAGTCFSGGPGGGAFADFFQNGTGPAGPGGSNGGAGGSGGGGGEGGVGNPSPARLGGSADTGTGGVLVVISGTTVSGSGSLVANGGSQTSSSASPAPNSGVCGGASGGGLVCLMGRSIGGPTLSAAGGTAIGTGFSPVNGGAGGAGFASQLIIP
jgi:hypothetical protein